MFVRTRCGGCGLLFKRVRVVFELFAYYPTSRDLCGVRLESSGMRRSFPVLSVFQCYATVCDVTGRSILRRHMSRTWISRYEEH